MTLLASVKTGYPERNICKHSKHSYYKYQCMDIAILNE
jgi:hypothetical protein